MRNIKLNYFALSELHDFCAHTRGDAPHVVRRLPVAFIFRAFGAVIPATRARGAVVLTIGLFETRPAKYSYGPGGVKWKLS